MDKANQGAPAARTTPRYIAGGGFGKQSTPMTARELREWGGRVEIGPYTIKHDQHDGWVVYVRTVVGTRSPVDTHAYVQSFTLYREAFAFAKREALRAASMRSAP